MFRPILALAAAALAGSPAIAATYSAKPASPKVERIAVRDMVWACGPQNCVGSTQNSRPLVLCQGLAKKAGPLDSFAVNGRAITAEELDRCNSAAPAADNSALANAR